ncbi:MAG: hypothetical protein KAR45_23390 [Desulfobacteraceae bacterium]|nr:hypothetical protein [Desulfobacteraceae bacterium]
MTESNNKHIKNTKNKNSQVFIIGIIIVILAIAVIYFINSTKKSTIVNQPVKKDILKKESYEAAYKKEIIDKPKPTINYNELEQNEDLKKTMEKRKKKYDLKTSLDMIVDSDETFKIKQTEISMAKILKQAALKRGEVVEEDIGKTPDNKEIKQYGIYIVKPGDNIWNIHFNILKEYYSKKNITMDMKADEPDKKGFSSGVGKILKFSEKLVIIYNLEQGTIDSNINIIEPLTKIIIYNMSEVFALLNDINYENVGKLQFDGKTIWIATDTQTNTQ